MRAAVWLWLSDRADSLRRLAWHRYEHARRRQWDREWKDAR